MKYLVTQTESISRQRTFIIDMPTKMKEDEVANGDINDLARSAADKADIDWEDTDDYGTDEIEFADASEEDIEQYEVIEVGNYVTWPGWLEEGWQWFDGIEIPEDIAIDIEEYFISRANNILWEEQGVATVDADSDIGTYLTLHPGCKYLTIEDVIDIEGDYVDIGERAAADTIAKFELAKTSED